MDPLTLHIESLIFAAEQPVTATEIEECLNACFDAPVSSQDITSALEELIAKYSDDLFSFELNLIAGGYSFMTKGAYHTVVGQYLKQHTRKMLSRAALETLAIIAYKQPVTKVEIESIRGVNCDYTIQKLLDKELISIKGRAEGPGRPLLYQTSERFMDYFGLKDISDLPKIKDFEKPENEIGDSNSIVEEAIRTTSQN